MYVVTGATGNTGKPIAEALLKAGHKVRIISRDAQKAQSLIDQGAEWINGSSTDKATLTKAFQGAKAAYILIPPAPQAEDFTAYQVQTTENIAQAIQETGLKHAVTLSSIGAHMPSNAGVVQGLHHMENRLNQIPGLNVLHLRPSYFLENTLGQVGAVKMLGMMASPLRGDFKMPMIATQDIANYATKRLQALDFTGHSTQDLLGAQEISYNEIAPIYGAKVGKPDLKYVQMPYEAFKGIMMQEWHASESFADNMNRFIQSANEGLVTGVAARNAESTTPTTIHDFANVFAHVYNN